MQPRLLGPRLGPRPLPLHLGTALMTWASSESAWRLWKPGSPSSNPSSAAPETLASLLPEIAALEASAGAGKFESALQREIARRMRRLADGVLVVPSLINRWEVLDLTAEKSLLRAMAAAGLRPYLVDWGTPNDEERC